MARWAALGALGAGARWGRGAAPCACALRRSGLGGRRAAGPRRRRGRTEGLTGGSPKVLGSRVHLAGTAVGKGIFLIQGSNPGLPHRWRILYRLSHHGKPNSRKAALHLPGCFRKALESIHMQTTGAKSLGA